MFSGPLFVCLRASLLHVFSISDASTSAYPLRA